MNLRDPIDITIRNSLDGDQLSAFGLPLASQSPFIAGEFVGDTQQGGPVNCNVLQIAPHGNGTHTESVSHIIDEMVAICDVVPLVPFRVQLVSVAVEKLSNVTDNYTEGEEMDRVIAKFVFSNDVDGIVIRTLPNSGEKKSAHHKNPPYLTEEAMQKIADSDLTHLLLDVPSVDREDDQGTLRNHRTFWRVLPGSHAADDETRTDRTITEMVFVGTEVPDGIYQCWISVPAFVTDAMSSRVVLFATDS